MLARDPTGALALKYNSMFLLRLTMKLRTDLTLNLRPILCLSLAPVTVSLPCGGADRGPLCCAEHEVGFTDSDPFTHRTDLTWLTVEVRQVSSGRGTESVVWKYFNVSLPWSEQCSPLHKEPKQQNMADSPPMRVEKLLMTYLAV